MAGLDAFNALPVKQKVGIIAGIGALVAAIFCYMLYNDLGKLGPDKENMFSFLVRDTGDGLWNDIAKLKKDIKGFKDHYATLKDRQDELDKITVEIELARQKLPAAREKSKIGKELGAFAVDVTNENLGSIAMNSITIKEEKAKSRSGRSKKKRGGAGKEPQSITFICQVETDISGLIAFINKVERSDQGEKSKRFMTVDGIEITPGGVQANLDEPQNPIIERRSHKAKLHINTWVLPE